MQPTQTTMEGAGHGRQDVVLMYAPSSDCTHCSKILHPIREGKFLEPSPNENCAKNSTSLHCHDTRATNHTQTKTDSTGREVVSSSTCAEPLPLREALLLLTAAPKTVLLQRSRGLEDAEQLTELRDTAAELTAAADAPATAATHAMSRKSPDQSIVRKTDRPRSSLLSSSSSSNNKTGLRSRPRADEANSKKRGTGNFQAA